MNGEKFNRIPDAERRRVLALLLAGGASTGVCLAQAEAVGSTGGEAPCNSLLWAVAWKQTAAEYFALSHQAYNLARLRVDQALAKRQPGEKSLAVITDMDDTIMHARSYWGHLINQNKEFFEDSIWDEWLPTNKITAAPGAKSFFDYCRDMGVEVFYVTNRDQGGRTYEYAMLQLEHLQLPFADDDHLYVFRDTSDKSPARDEIAASFSIAVMLGDNLNDYRRDYYVKDIDERMRLMERDRDHWGRDFILLPNPTDGHWVRAIFGDSEPAATDENRRLLMKAATRLAWSG
jgi:5'-nucleotidase (lipoprotein e(P4) family)